jgi:hypothetical protein
MNIRGCAQKFTDWQPEPELQMVQFSATRCNCIAILWVILVSFVAINHCVASQRVFIVVIVYFVIEWVRELFDIPSFMYGRMVIQLHAFLTSVLVGAEWSAPHHGRFTTGESLRHPLDRTLCGAKHRGGEEKNKRLPRPCRKSNPGRSVRNLDTILTELPWLLLWERDKPQSA